MFSRTHLFGAIFNAWAYGFLRYLSKPNFADNITNENGVTLILDNDAPRQANRPAVWNRVLVGDGSTTLNFGSITGIMYAAMDTGSGWTVGPLILGLSGAVLTLQSGTKYKLFYDDAKRIVCERGQGTSIPNVTGISSYTLSADTVWGTDDTVPFEYTDGDVNGIISADEGEFPIGYVGTMTSPTTYTGKKDWPLTVNEVPHISLDESLGDSLSISVGILDLATVTITEVRGVRHGTTTKLAPSDFVINTISNEIEVNTGLVVDLNYIKFSNLWEATYMGGKDASGNVLGSTNFRFNHTVTENTFTVNVLDVDTSTVLVDGGFAPEVELGSSFAKILNINSSHYVLLTAVADSPTNKRLRYRYQGSGANTYNGPELQTDGSGTPITDDDGESQGWTTIGSESVFNQYIDYADVNITKFSDSDHLGQYSLLEPGNILFNFYIKSGSGFSSITFQDYKQYEDLIALINTNYGSSLTIFTWNRQQLFRALNGGMPSSGTGFPNGADDNYPDTTLGISGLTSTQIRTYWGQVFEQDTTSSNFLQIHFDNGQYNLTFGGLALMTKYYTLTILNNNIGYNINKFTTDGILSTGNAANAYFNTYNRTPKRINQLSISRANSLVKHWVRWKTLSINGVELIPPLTDGTGFDSFNGLELENPPGNHLDTTTKVALPPFRTITEQEMGNLTGAFDFARDKDDDTYDRLLIAAYDDAALSTQQTDKANAYTA